MLPCPTASTSITIWSRRFGRKRCPGTVATPRVGIARRGQPIPFDRRAAVVFIHPAKPQIPIIEDIPGPIVDYPFDTTRTAVLVLNGVEARNPRVKIILSHAGGFVPYAAHRFAELAPAVRLNLPPAPELIESFRSFYFDTALSSGPASLLALQNFARPGHILYGSDFPYAPVSVGASFTAKIDSFDFPRDVRAAINDGGARQIFARFREAVAA